MKRLLLIVIIISLFSLRTKTNIKNDYISYNLDDIIVYINIDDLNLTRNLMQGLDNEFYFNHNYMKVEDSNGEFFLDTYGDLKNDINTIIYTKVDNLDINKLSNNSIINIKYLDNNYCFQINSVKKDLILKIFNENEEIDILCKKIMC